MKTSKFSSMLREIENVMLLAFDREQTKETSN